MTFQFQCSTELICYASMISDRLIYSSYYDKKFSKYEKIENIYVSSL